MFQHLQRDKAEQMSRCQFMDFLHIMQRSLNVFFDESGEKDKKILSSICHYIFFVVKINLMSLIFLLERSF